MLRRARGSFHGRIGWRFGVAVAAALLAGAASGVLPAVVGQALGAVAGPAGGSARPASGFARLVAALMPASSAWLVVLVTLAATVAVVAVSVLSTRLGSSLTGEVTAAVRIEMLSSVLGASARDVAAAGAAIAGAGKPRPPGAGPQSAPAGKAAGGAPAARFAPDGTEVVKLAVSREAAMVSEFAVSVLTGLPQAVATLLVLAYELCVGGAWFALLGGIGLFLLSRLVANRAARRVGAASRELQSADAAVFASLQEKLGGIEDLRLWGARGEAVAEFAQVARQVSEARTRFAAALALSGQIKSVFTAMSPLLIVVALELAGGGHDAGEVAQLLLVVPLLLSRLEALDSLRMGLIERAPLIDASARLLALPEAPVRAPEALRLEPDEIEGALSFENVRFTPPGAARPVIDGVTLTIPAGAIVGICGPSGGGKSVLLRLLLRLDDPDVGSICLDGVDLRRLEPAQLPQLFGVLRQTSQLPQRPVRESLGLGLQPKPSRQAMVEVLGRVRMDELAAERSPDRSLDTAYRANPANFSGGELRRLLLARMLLGPARVFVLDEPEAGLPSGTAEEIIQTVVAQARGRTLLVVTHAPHLLGSRFNVVLAQGRVVAVGPHAELVESCQIYRDLLADALKGAAG
ncbi:MAG: ABC transporter ATP-binding protein [Deltaproteobacteria bacterium]|nr:ABC transporter ATP-binding protein [Deltaproteobacteria bacterium]